MTDNFILADGRWTGANGIGRFSKEVLARLQNTEILAHGPKPLSPKNFVWLPYELHKRKQNHKVFFMPGFNPVIHSPIPFVFTICDLIHLQFPGKSKFAKKLYYDLFIKPGTYRAHKILTISEYSKETIMEWANVPAEKIAVVSCGISENLTPHGARYQPGYPYLLHVGNTKSHKNVARLLTAFAVAKIDSGIRILLTGEKTPELSEIIKNHRLEKRVIFSGLISESQLAEYYRGALAVTFPSLYEGFGLPVLEAMACGTPALTSDATSLPEVAGDAAILINPYEVESIMQGIEKIISDNSLRNNLIKKGLERVKLFSWDKTANSVQSILNKI
ncbi:MAG: glycosyltransferase family 4 protein [Gammaproteobacteria bacterium]